MKRHLIFILGVALLIAAANPSSAQDNSGSWSALLYVPHTASLLKITADRQTESITLPLPDGDVLYSYNVVISNSGTQVAYLTNNPLLPQEKRLLIYDWRTERILLAYDLDPIFASSIDTYANRGSFNDTDSQFALGIAKPDYTWGILIFDLETGTLAQQLSDNNPAVADWQTGGGILGSPVIHRFYKQQLSFSIQMAASEGVERYPGYVWSLHDNTIQPLPLQFGRDYDILESTGEVLAALSEADLQVTREQFAYFQGEALYLMQLTEQNAKQSYTSNSAYFSMPRFVQSGQLLAAALYHPDGRRTLAVVDREGTFLWENGAADLISLAGISDGLLYTTHDRSTGLSQLYHLATVTAEPLLALVWEEESSQQFSVVWAGSL